MGFNGFMAVRRPRHIDFSIRTCRTAAGGDLDQFMETVTINGLNGS